jgi:hypothetical protein
LQEWNLRAMRPEVRFNVKAWGLQSNAEETAVASAFWKCLGEGAQTEGGILDGSLLDQAKGQLEELHEEARRKTLQELDEENRAIVNRRKASLDLYYDRQITRVRRESEDAVEPKIRTMKEAQRARLIQRRDEILGKLRSFERTDILAKNVAMVLLTNRPSAGRDEAKPHA